MATTLRAFEAHRLTPPPTLDAREAPDDICWLGDAPPEAFPGDSGVGADIAPGPSLAARIGRGGLGLSIALHLLLAAALAGLAAPVAEEAMEQGETVVSVAVFGDGAVDSIATETVPVPEPEEDPDLAPAEKPRPKPAAEPVAEPVPKTAAEAEPVETRAKTPVDEKNAPFAVATRRERRDTSLAPAEARAAADREDEPDPAARPDVAEEPVIKTNPVPVVDPTTDRDRADRAEVAPAAKTAEAKPEPKAVDPEKPIEKKARPPVVRKAEQKKKPRKPERKTPQKKQNKASTIDARKGDSEAADRKTAAREASAGNAKLRVKGNAALDTYLGKINRQLAKARKKARGAGRGTVVVSFVIGAGGNVGALRLSASSGNPRLDAMALALIRKAGAFPPIPPEAGRKTWPMRVPIEFR